MGMTNLSSIYWLMSWFSASYPIGSFNFSHGLEYAIESGLIKDEGSLETWISGIMHFGSGRIDLVLFKYAYHLCAHFSTIPESSFVKKLQALIVLSNALKLAPELWQESVRQGNAALKALLKTHPSQPLQCFNTYLQGMKKQPVVSLVFGLAAAVQQIPLTWALMAYLHAFILNLVMAGVKLLPLGQTAGQNIMLRLEPSMQKNVALALKTDIEHIGGAAPMVEWTSVKHENQYTRLFQS
jgi:urease accessory protein